MRARLPEWTWSACAIGAIILGSFFPGPQRAAISDLPQPHPMVSFFFLTLASVIFVLLRHRSPMFAMVGTAITFMMSAWLYLPSLGAGIAVTICAYALAEKWSRTYTFAATAAVVLPLLLLAVGLTGWQGIDVRVFPVAAAVAFSAALGDSDRSRREYLDEILDRAERAEKTREAEAQRRVTEERLRIARDLHDTVAHQISVISLNAGVASSATSDPRAQVALSNIRTASRSALSEISGLLQYLRTDEHTRPPTDFSPEADPHQRAPQPGLSDLSTLTKGVNVIIDGDLTRVTGAADVAAYRVTQEALTNARKHGTGTPDLTIRVNDDLTITVVNTRREIAGEGTGLGLIGIRERVNALGGTVKAGPERDRYTLTAHLPLTREP